MQYEITKDEFEKKYDIFLDKLSYKEEGSFHKLLTKNNKAFGVLRNQNSIYIKALTDKQSEMTISKKQLMNVVINDKNYNLVSYEPVLIDYIINNKLNSNEQYKYDEYYNDEVRNMFNSDNNVSEQKLESRSKNKIKNIILYGSPGVGKTYSVEKLIRLIEMGIPEKKIFEIIKNNELNNVVGIDGIKDRVKFITFHQSFGYEDFIEGFRPNEDGKIILEDGIFKQISQNKLRINIFQQRVGFFKTECLDNDIDVKQMIRDLNSKIHHNAPVKQILFEEEYIALILENNARIEILNIDLEQWLHSIIDGETIQNIEDNYISYNFGRKVRYVDIVGSVLIDRIKYNQQYEDLKNNYKKLSKEKKENVYLVIDEINRGNISKIFGELITLIEEDKRDTLEVTLPYSKKPFKIPSNLYIIGTMNSTDKSIALIDIALRRRFTFLKMEPNVELVDNVKAKNIMQQLNEKITKTLGPDYVLGHSYFMKIENDDDLDFVLEYKITPLLEEYFYGDDQGLKNVMEIVKYDGDDDTE